MQRPLSLHRNFILMCLAISLWCAIQGLQSRSLQAKVEAKAAEGDSAERETAEHETAEAATNGETGAEREAGGEAQREVQAERGVVGSSTSRLLTTLQSAKAQLASFQHQDWSRLSLSGLLPASYGQLNSVLIPARTLEPGEVPVAIQTSQQTVGRVLVDLSDRKLYLYTNGDLASEYDVAIGRKEWETPIGQYRVGDMQQDPAWEHPLTGRIVSPGPENPLGAAWIGFLADGDYSFGLHGTLDESLMGEAVSHGCVRMRNDDIIELYEQVQPGWPLEVVR